VAKGNGKEHVGIAARKRNDGASDAVDDYGRAFEHWKHNQPLAIAGAENRMSREELHERK
jgi:hypothetical protein